MGAAYAELGLWEEMELASLTAASLKPDFKAYSNQATAFFFQGRFREAKESYELATTLSDERNRKSHVLWGNYAELLYWAPLERERSFEQYRKAVALAQEALAQAPEDGSVYTLLAVFHAMLGERETSLQHLAIALELDPGNAETMYNAALVHKQLGGIDQAFDWLFKATEAGVQEAKIKNHPMFEDVRTDARFLVLFPTSSPEDIRH